MYLQLIGTTMGTKAAPTIANIYMESINILILEAAKQIMLQILRDCGRFVDNIFGIWIGNENQLKKLMEAINQSHPNLKFSINYNFTARSTTTYHNHNFRYRGLQKAHGWSTVTFTKLVPSCPHLQKH